MSSIAIHLLQAGADDAPARVFEGPVVRIGREVDNDLVITGPSAGKVSRYHAQLRLEGNAWSLHDANSSHGTFVSSRRVSEALLRDGDEIRLAADGPRLRVGLRAAAAPSPRTEMAPSLRDSMVHPWKMGYKPIAARGYLVPGLTAALGLSVLHWSAQYNLQLCLLLIVLALTLGSTVLLYRLAGKRKKIWPLIAAAVAVVVLVATVHLFLFNPLIGLLFTALGYAPPGSSGSGLPDPESLGARFVMQFLSAGLPEELEKSAPALLGFYLYARARRSGTLSSPPRSLWVREPLDGILLAIAGAAGFNFFEALLYVNSNFIQMAQMAGDAGSKVAGAPELLGRGFSAGAMAFYQALSRGVGSVFGHQAYSGIFGYYIGLAGLHPVAAKRLILRGAATAMVLHAMWNALCDTPGLFLLPAISFLALISCVVKARAVSPERTNNFATMVAR